MTNRKKIIKYMKLKHKAFLEFSPDYPLYNQEDYDEINKLPLYDIKDIWETLAEKIRSATFLCPHCILNPNDCDNCNYGKRHGICNGTEENNWNKIDIWKTPLSISGICHPIIDKIIKEK